MFKNSWLTASVHSCIRSATNDISTSGTEEALMDRLLNSHFIRDCHYSRLGLSSFLSNSSFSMYLKVRSYCSTSSTPPPPGKLSGRVYHLLEQIAVLRYFLLYHEITALCLKSHYVRLMDGNQWGSFLHNVTVLLVELFLKPCSKTPSTRIKIN